MTSLIVTKGQVVAKLARGTPTIPPRSYSKDLKEETRMCYNRLHYFHKGNNDID